MSNLDHKIKYFQENTGIGILLDFPPTVEDCDFDNVVLLTRIFCH